MPAFRGLLRAQDASHRAHGIRAKVGHSVPSAQARASVLFLRSMHPGSSEWTNRNNRTLCNLASRAGRVRFVLGDRVWIARIQRNARATKRENKIKCSAQDAPHRSCRFSTYLTPSTTRPCACFAFNAERSFGPSRDRTAPCGQQQNVMACASTD
jgi:hypothetical protein